MMGQGFGNGFNMMGGYGWFGVLLTLLFGALIIAGIVLLVFWVVRASGSHGTGGGASQPPGGTGHDEAVAVAKRRFASGEITKEQYEEIISTLGG
jgi:putative membrane protein